MNVSALSLGKEIKERTVYFNARAKKCIYKIIWQHAKMIIMHCSSHFLLRTIDSP